MAPCLKVIIFPIIWEDGITRRSGWGWRNAIIRRRRPVKFSKSLQSLISKITLKSTEPRSKIVSYVSHSYGQSHLRWCPVNGECFRRQENLHQENRSPFSSKRKQSSIFRAIKTVKNCLENIDSDKCNPS